MHEAQGWLLDVRAMNAVIAVWLAIVLIHGLWRSAGAAPQDPIRESGPT